MIHVCLKRIQQTFSPHGPLPPNANKYGKKGDVFLAISTSGNSANILKALETARKMNLKTIGLTGENGGKMRNICDICLMVPSK